MAARSARDNARHTVLPWRSAYRSAPPLKSKARPPQRRKFRRDVTPANSRRLGQEALNADLAYWESTLALQQARAAVYADSVALFQALGGGWWNRA
jgi:hypothetical protein